MPRVLDASGSRLGRPSAWAVAKVSSITEVHFDAVVATMGNEKGRAGAAVAGGWKRVKMLDTALLPCE